MNARQRFVVLARMLLTIVLIAGMLHGSNWPAASADQIDIHGPAGSGAFGTSVIVLPNGNFVVTDPTYDHGSTVDVGAVYLYNGASGTLISALTGTSAGDQVGSMSVTVLSNGNFLVRSPDWDNGATADAGAVTWGSAASGVSGPVSAGNSLVGGTANEQVGAESIVQLSNSNYLVSSPDWDSAGAVDAGAVTWGSGSSGVTGTISPANSLVGSTTGDRIGYRSITPLANGSFVVRSPLWDNAGIVDAGAATWGSGTSGVSGLISVANSLVGSTANDQVSSDGVSALGNGNYVVGSSNWSNGAALSAGAVTFGKGTGATFGAVSAGNSLVGSLANDRVGSGGVTMLNNDNYVVSSPSWDNGVAVDAGAATWGSGISGVSGPISGLNSLVGTQPSNMVSFDGVFRFANGNYVVVSSWWDSAPLLDIGAVTWGNGATGITGPVSGLNSLVGSTPGDRVGGSGVTILSNGSYVVGSSWWDNGAIADAGAVTWGSSAGGSFGVVSPANSLVGSTTNDFIGIWTVTELSNGHFVVSIPHWDNGAMLDAGAVTWGNGSSGITGLVSAANSLVGSTANDRVGFGGVTALTNGNYVVSSPLWDNGTAADAGAVTWGNGAGGIAGLITSANSLMGNKANDNISSSGGVVALSNGNYVVISSGWNSGAVVAAGAVTWGDGSTGTSGVVAANNSLVGSTANDGVGCGGVTELSDGDYVVKSYNWSNGSAAFAGAATWGNGNSGVSGVVSAVNSLVGSTANDSVGMNVIPLRYGNYVVESRFWNNGAVVDAGAVAWGDGINGTFGVVSALNSLVGVTAFDLVGSSGASAQGDGNYIVISPSWDNIGATDAGAVSWGNATLGSTGAITAVNSIRGTAANGGVSIVAKYDVVNNQLVVGRPADNIVTLFRPGYGASIDPPTGSLSGAPGTMVNYTLQLTNTGNFNDTFDILVSGNSWTTNAPTTAGPLAPGASQNVTVSVTVPASAGGGSTDQATITVASQADPSKSDSATLITTSDNVYGITLDPTTSTDSGAPGELVIHTLQVTNTGNITDTFSLAVDDNTWITQAPETVGPIAASASQTVEVRVQVPALATGGSQDAATITVTSQANGAILGEANLLTVADNVYDATVAAHSSAKSGAPGAVVTYTVQITNTGNVTESFTLAVDDNIWTTDVPAIAGPVAPGASQAVEVRVQIPASAGDGSTDIVTIIVACQADPAQTATVSLTTQAVHRRIYLPMILR